MNSRSLRNIYRPTECCSGSTVRRQLAEKGPQRGMTNGAIVQFRNNILLHSYIAGIDSFLLTVLYTIPALNNITMMKGIVTHPYVEYLLDFERSINQRSGSGFSLGKWIL